MRTFKMDSRYIFLAENINHTANTNILFDKYSIERAAAPRETSFLDLFLEKNIGILTSNSPFIKGFKETKEYNLWVIKHPYNKSHSFVKYLFALSSHNLTQLIEWFDQDSSNYLVVNDLATKIVYSEMDKDKFPVVDINNDTIIEFQFLWDLLKDFNEKKREFPRLVKILNDLVDLKSIHRDTSFKFLGYFSILEHILTHNKGRNIGHSSINLQLQNKLNLLNNRFNSMLDFHEYFNTPNTVDFIKIIEKLYHYRSDIAHGSISDFEKELSILKNQKYSSLKFIHELCRRVIIQYLKEPRLIEDLKKC
jgi:hypothetical protein